MWKQNDFVILRLSDYCWEKAQREKRKKLTENFYIKPISESAGKIRTDYSSFLFLSGISTRELMNFSASIWALFFVMNVRLSTMKIKQNRVKKSRASARNQKIQRACELFCFPYGTAAQCNRHFNVKWQYNDNAMELCVCF